jgi:hypothetical protein
MHAAAADAAADSQQQTQQQTPTGRAGTSQQPCGPCQVPLPAPHAAPRHSSVAPSIRAAPCTVSRGGGVRGGVVAAWPYELATGCQVACGFVGFQCHCARADVSAAPCIAAAACRIFCQRLGGGRRHAWPQRPVLGYRVGECRCPHLGSAAAVTCQQQQRHVSSSRDTSCAHDALQSMSLLLPTCLCCCYTHVCVCVCVQTHVFASEPRLLQGLQSRAFAGLAAAVVPMPSQLHTHHTGLHCTVGLEARGAASGGLLVLYGACAGWLVHAASTARGSRVGG